MSQFELMGQTKVTDDASFKNYFKRLFDKIAKNVVPLFLWMNANVCKCECEVCECENEYEIKEIIDTVYRVNNVMRNTTDQAFKEKATQQYLSDPSSLDDPLPRNTLFCLFFAKKDEEVLAAGVECRDREMADSIHADLLVAQNKKEAHLGFYAVGARHLLSESGTNIVDRLRAKGWDVRRVNYAKILANHLFSHLTPQFFQSAFSLEDVISLQNQAMHAYNNDDYKNAVKYFLQLLEITKNQIDVQVKLYNILSSCYIHQGEFIAAIAAAKSSIEIHQQCQKKPNFSQTLKILQDAETLQSAHEMAETALNSFRKNEYKKAAKLFEKSIITHSSVLSRSKLLATYHYNCATCYEQLGDNYLFLAIDHVEKAFKLNLDFLGRGHEITQSTLKKLTSLEEKLLINEDSNSKKCCL